MKITKELDLENFEAWSGAIDTLDTIKAAGKIAECQQLIEDMYFDLELTETHLNNLLWFEDEWLFEQLGINPESDED